MKETFTPGAIVRWNTPDGGLAEIQHYLKDGFYAVKSIPEGRELIGREEDLILAKEDQA